MSNKHIEGRLVGKGNGGACKLMTSGGKGLKGADQTDRKDRETQHLFTSAIFAAHTWRNPLWSSACSSLQSRFSSCPSAWAPEPVPEPDTLPELLCHEVCHLCPLRELTPAHPVPGVQRQPLWGPGCGYRANEWVCPLLRYSSPPHPCMSWEPVPEISLCGNPFPPGLGEWPLVLLYSGIISSIYEPSLIKETQRKRVTCLTSDRVWSPSAVFSKCLFFYYNPQKK